MSLPSMNKERRPQSIDLVRLVRIEKRKHPANLVHARDLHGIISLTIYLWNASNTW